MMMTFFLHTAASHGSGADPARIAAPELRFKSGPQKRRSSGELEASDGSVSYHLYACRDDPFRPRAQVAAGSGGSVDMELGTRNASEEVEGGAQAHRLHDW